MSHLLFLIIFTNPSARAGYDTRSIFKQSLTGLNSEFSFSYLNSLVHMISYDDKTTPRAPIIFDGWFLCLMAYQPM